MILFHATGWAIGQALNVYFEIVKPESAITSVISIYMFSLVYLATAKSR